MSRQNDGEFRGRSYRGEVELDEAEEMMAQASLRSRSQQSMASHKHGMEERPCGEQQSRYTESSSNYNRRDTTESNYRGVNKMPDRGGFERRSRESEDGYQHAGDRGGYYPRDDRNVSSEARHISQQSRFDRSDHRDYSQAEERSRIQHNVYGGSHQADNKYQELEYQRECSSMRDRFDQNREGGNRPVERTYSTERTGRDKMAKDYEYVPQSFRDRYNPEGDRIGPTRAEQYPVEVSSSRPISDRDDYDTSRAVPDRNISRTDTSCYYNPIDHKNRNEAGIKDRSHSNEGRYDRGMSRDEYDVERNYQSTTKDARERSSMAEEFRRSTVNRNSENLTEYDTSRVPRGGNYQTQQNYPDNSSKFVSTGNNFKQDQFDRCVTGRDAPSVTRAENYSLEGNADRMNSSLGEFNAPQQDARDCLTPDNKSDRSGSHISKQEVGGLRSDVSARGGLEQKMHEGVKATPQSSPGVSVGRGSSRRTDTGYNSTPNSRKLPTHKTESHNESDRSLNSPLQKQGVDVGHVTSSPSNASDVVAVGRGQAMLQKQLATYQARQSQESQQPQQQEAKVPARLISPGKPLVVKNQPPVLRHGESGKTIPMTANYIKLDLIPGKGVYEYDVQFEPEVDSKDFRFKLLGQMKDIIGPNKTFDGVTLYLPFKLKDEVTTRLSPHPGDDSGVTISITYRRQKKMGECIHLYNVLLKRIMSELQLARLGRQHFDPNAAKVIPQHKLEVWPGYVTAVDEYEGGVLLCCDTSSRVLRTQTVLELIYEVSQKQNNGDWNIAVKDALIGQSVLTRYNNRLYRIDDMDFKMCPRSTFKTSTGQEISFSEYYKKQYDLQIKDLNQPMLQSKSKKKIQGRQEIEQLIVLVPELCYLTGLTDDMRNDFRVMKDIATYTRITPNQRHYALKQYLNSVSRSEKSTQMLKDWGLKFANDTIELSGRIVDSEKIFFGQTSECMANQNADWTGQLTRSRVFQAAELLNWCILFTQRDNRYAGDFEQTMHRVGPPMGMFVERANMIRLQDDRTDTYIKMLREIINPKLQLVVIIFPTPRDDRYSAVKRLCCADLPVASQVINSRTLSKPDKLRSIVQKIALQINCKLGGSLWSIVNPYKSAMVIGIDTYHDKMGRGRSVGGFVASLNSTLTHWYSKCCIQNSNTELINGLKVCFIEALQRFYAVNNKFPDRVFVFRDGVGDGLLQVTLEHEVEQFKSCFGQVDPSFHPRFSFVIVSKKINTKLFIYGNKDIQNPPPGTVMDNTVNRRNYFDFFLVSQCVRQGTVSPTHYIVLYDNSDIKPDHIQRFSYKLCHMYYNWSGTVRVPAPCQYAHKLAQLVGMHILREHHPSLSERLFFL